MVEQEPGPDLMKLLIWQKLLRSMILMRTLKMRTLHLLLLLPGLLFHREGMLLSPEVSLAASSIATYNQEVPRQSVASAQADMSAGRSASRNQNRSQRRSDPLPHPHQAVPSAKHGN
jgi:hypothetical protein